MRPEFAAGGPEGALTRVREPAAWMEARSARPCRRRASGASTAERTRARVAGWPCTAGTRRARTRGPSHVFSVVPRNVCRSIRCQCVITNHGSCANASGMWRTLIHRSARQRMNSTSSALRCSVRTTAVVPSYSSTASLTIRFRSRKSFVIGVPGYGVGCWMYGQSTYRRANSRFASTDSARVVRDSRR